MITIIGLGNTKDDLTLRGKKAIASSTCVAVRSKKLKQVSRFKSKISASMDEFFDVAQSFDQLNSLIVERLIALEKTHGDVVYLVSGDGYSDGAAIGLSERDFKFQLIQGVSNFGAKMPSFSTLSHSASEILSILPLFDSAVDLSISEITDKFLASEVKLALLKSYCPSTNLRFLSKGILSEIQLTELDRQKSYDHTTSIFVKGNSSFQKGRYCMADLIRVIERLTAIDGCEWDKEQTHQSIRVNLIEEAYEAVDAIDNDDLDAMVEELGDVMLQSVLHADIAKRSGEFDFFDMVHGLTNKLVSRHTHIFGSEKATNSQEALGFWEAAKAKEKSVDSLSQALDNVPDGFAALLKAQKMIKRAKKQVCELDKDAIVLEIKNKLEAQNYGAVLFLVAALCEANGHFAEVELNKISSDFKQNCLSLTTKKSVTELV